MTWLQFFRRPDFLPAVATILAQAVSFSGSALRWQFLNIAAAIALLSIAFVAIAPFFFRRKARDLTLIYFGAFCSARAQEDDITLLALDFQAAGSRIQ